MKRFIITLFTILTLSFISVDVYAAARLDKEEILSESKDLEEIKALEADIIMKAKHAFGLNGVVTSIEGGVRIDYDNAIRVFTDYRVLEAAEVSAGRVEDIVDLCYESMHYAWQVPVYFGDDDCCAGVVVARQHPIREDARDYLSPEYIEWVTMNEGKYVVTDADILGENGPIMTYVREMAEKLDDDCMIKVFGSQPGFSQPVGIVISDDKVSGLFSLGYIGYPAFYYGKEPMETGRLYDYSTLYNDELSEMIADIDYNIENNLMIGASGGMKAPEKSSLPAVLIIAVAAVAVLLSGLFIVKKFRSCKQA